MRFGEKEEASQRGNGRCSQQRQAKTYLIDGAVISEDAPSERERENLFPTEVDDITL